jgi:oligosaccharide repeat unit polymerase
MELKILYFCFIIFFFYSVIQLIYKSEKQLINAYSFFALEFFVKILLSSLLVYIFTDTIVNYNESLKVLYISFVFLFSIWAGFSLDKPAIFLLKRSGIFFVSTKGTRWLYSHLKLVAMIFIIIALILYIFMMFKGGGDLLWITNSRYAYQHHREGVGTFYVFSQTLLYIAYIIYLYKMRKKSIIRITVTTIIFLVIFYFFGSKRSMLTLMLIGVVYYSYFVRRLNLVKLFLVFILLIILFLFSQILYSNLGLNGSLNYFTYFDNMVLFLVKNPSFEFMNGGNFLSGAWGVVPRELYPDKPHVYGSAYITEFIYPGMPEKGHYLGVLPWAVYYLDFGFIGVFIGGFLTGISLKYIQKLFKYNKNIFVFILFINYAISNIMKFVPTMVLFLLIILFINFLRLKLRSD